MAKTDKKSTVKSPSSDVLSSVRTLGRTVTGLNEAGVVVALASIVAVIAFFHPDFLSEFSLINVGRQAALIGTMAVGMVFLLSMREIDISVGSIFGACVIAVALLMREGMDPWVAAFLGILMGTALGAINGVLGNTLRVATIIVTLGTLTMYRALALILSDSTTVTGLPTKDPFFTILGGDLLGIPVSIWIFAGVTVVVSILYRRTRFGFLVRAVGSNEEAAAMSGMPIARVRLYSLMLMGALCGIAGMVTLAFFGTADPNIGSGYEIQVIAAAIIGGTSLSGGTGTVIGAALGAITISVINSGLIQFGVTANWSGMVTGGVIIAAVALDGLVRRRQGRNRTSQDRDQPG